MCMPQDLSARVGLLGATEPLMRESVLEGLIASIGGLDGSLSNAASNALTAWLRPPGMAEGKLTPMQPGSNGLSIGLDCSAIPE